MSTPLTTSIRPAVVIDLDVLEKNINGMQQVCRDAGIDLMVHIKTHKVPQIAHMQLRAGAVGICCQKLGEAEVMVAAGIEGDVLIPYNIVGRPKLVRLARLAKRARMTVAVDSEITARGISEQLRKDSASVRVFVELDTGGKRTGVQSPPGRRRTCPNSLEAAEPRVAGGNDIPQPPRSESLH